MGGDHMCPVCSATFTRPQHVARHMRSHTGDRPYGCQMCGDRFARSDLLSRHVNKCHTPGGLANTTSRKGQSSRAQAAAEDKKRRPCEACTLQSTKCDFGKPCSNCNTRGTKCAYPKAKRARRNTNPSPSAHPTNLPANPQGIQESHPMSTFAGGYQDDITPFNFNYPPQDGSIPMPHLFEPPLSVPGTNSNAFMGSPEAPSLSFSATTSDSAESTPWNTFEYMGGMSGNNGLDTNTMFPDPNAPSFSSSHKLQSQGNNPFAYNVDQSQYEQQPPLTALHQRPGSGVQRHAPAHHQRHRSTPSLEGSQPLLNNALLRAQAQQYPAVTPNRIYMHRGSISASDSGTEYESSGGRPSTAGGYSDYPSPMSLTNSETGSVGQGVGRALDDMSLHDPAHNNNILSLGSMIVPGIGMGTGLTPAVESPSRPSMTQRQSTFGDLRAFWNECMDRPSGANVGNAHGNGNESRHSLAKMTSMPCLKTPLGEATPRAAAQDPLARVGQKGNAPSLQTPRATHHTDPKSLEQYQHAIDSRQPPSLQIAPKMKAAAAKQEDADLNNINKQDPSFAMPFPPGSAQAGAWRSLMNTTAGDNKYTGSYVAESTRPSYKRLPSQTLGPENSKRAHHDGNDSEGAVYTDDDEEEDYKQAQQEWHRRMSLPAGIGRGRLYQPQPVPVPSPRIG